MIPDRATAGPIDGPHRIRSLDILRGVAVLGIFMMNSRNFALPLQQFDNPAFPDRLSDGARPVDLWTWAISNLLFEDKMIAIFSILFGAGMVLATARAARPALLHYRRMFWLFLIGLAHAYLLWYGDILNTYAICGAALYPLRRLRPVLLIALGAFVLTVAIWARVGPPIYNTLSPETSAASVESRADRIWRESVAAENAAYHGSYLDLLRWRAHLNTFWHFDGGLSFSFWRCGGFMLIGMGLVQLGVLSAVRPASLYIALLISGYGFGSALAAVGMWPQLARIFGRAPELSPAARPIVGLSAWTLRYSAAAFIAFGHTGLILLLCRAAALRSFLSPFAAAGRMALSNYLLQTIIAVIIFDGWALGQWGRWRMSQIAALVAAVWIAQLILSPVWLRYFRFGPAEWLWRSLTYWKPQPLLRAAPAIDAEPQAAGST